MATCFSSLSNAQDYTTDNLLQNNNTSWEGCYTQTSGAFWGGYSGGPCPGINSSGQIIFSWGTNTLSQTININNALSAAGAGIRIDGYNYSWWTKNSNINDQQPGSHDYFSRINVDLLDSSGKIIVSDLYDYGYRLSEWTRFSGSRTYDNPYSLTDAESFRVSATARDDGFWAGYYGPEYRDFDVSLKYSVDPCISDPLYSSLCPGYVQALLESLPKSVTSEIVESTPVATSEPVQDSAPAAQQTTQQAEPSTGEVAPTQSVAASSSSTSGGQQSAGRPRVSLSTILNIHGAEQSRIANVERSTVEASIEQSARESDRSMQEAEAIASGAVSESILVGVTSSQQASELFSATVSQSDYQNKSTTSVSGFSAVSVLNSDAKILDNDSKQEEKTESVKQNVPNNTLAGNVTLASLGAQPAGFQAYLSIIPDSAFYAPKEIYRNQTTVDNRRLLRQLSGASDRLYQKMIDQQYGEIK